MRDLRISDDLRRKRNFVSFWPLNNARFHRFPVGQISRNLNTTTLIGIGIKTFRTEFENFTIRGRFSQKTQKFLTKFQHLETSSRHIRNYYLQIAGNSLPNNPSTGYLVFIFTVRIIIQNHSPWLYKKPTPKFLANLTPVHEFRDKPCHNIDGLSESGLMTSSGHAQVKYGSYGGMTFAIPAVYDCLVPFDYKIMETSLSVYRYATIIIRPHRSTKYVDAAYCYHNIT